MAIKAETRAASRQYDMAEFAIAITSALGLSIAALFLCVAPMMGNIAGARDFVVYWATGQQLVHHGNPYAMDTMMQAERGAGLPGQYGVLFMRNPPWALPIAYPLGLVGVRLGALLWSLLLLGCLGLSVYLQWQMHGCPPNLLSFLGYSFAPALVCLLVGQTSLFALLGLVLFLRLYRAWPFWSFALAVRSQAAPVSGIRRGASRLGGGERQLQNPAGFCCYAGRQLCALVGHRTYRLGRLCAHDADLRHRKRIHPLLECGLAPLD